MARPVRIGNAHGFWGDRIEAAAEMLAAAPDLDFITLDFLAEVSMSILAVQRSRNADAGWPRDFLDVIRSLTPYWRAGGRCRLIANAGGLNPLACARACQQILIEAGCGDRSIAVVSGDDVLNYLRLAPADSLLLHNLDTDETLGRISNHLVTANAYLGAKPIGDALTAGADIVITGRVADPSLTVGACAYFHGWEWDDWDRLAQATVAGHLIECGTQVTGGIATNWLDVPDIDQIGFPIVEIEQDGTFAVTKPLGTGGIVSEATVKEQLVYEIGDPGAYLSPDVTVSLLGVVLREEAEDRIRVTGARGRPAPASYKVSATYQDGYRAQGQLTIYGDNAVAKALRAGEAVLQRLKSRGIVFRESLVECLGTEACNPAGGDPEFIRRLRETVLRVSVADESRESVEHFTRELMPLITAGPPGTTGYAEGRPRIHPIFRYWPCLIEREHATAVVSILESAEHNGTSIPSVLTTVSNPTAPTELLSVGKAINPVTPPGAVAKAKPRRSLAGSHNDTVSRLSDIATARSGDKGQGANIGVIAIRPEFYDFLYQNLTAAAVASFLGITDASRVTRYELPNLGAFNFLVRGVLANTLRVDAQGKTLGQVLLNFPLSNMPLAKTTAASS